MRILVLSVDFPPHSDGVSSLTYHYVRRLSENGNIVTVVAPRASGSKAIDAGGLFNCHRFPGYSLGPFRVVPFLLCALWAVFRSKPDVVLPMNIGYGGPFAYVLSVLGFARYITIAYAYEFLKVRHQAILRRLYLKIYERSVFTVAISRYTRSRLVEFGLESSRIRVLYPGIQQEFATAEGSESGGSTIGTCGRLIHRKGHDLVIAALPRIREVMPGIKYRIAGDGPEGERLKAMSKELGVEDLVEFLGVVSAGDLSAFYSSLDLFVMPAREDYASGHVEGFGIVYVEAAIHGVPALAARTGGAPEAVLDGVTGTVVAPESVDEIANTVISMLTMPCTLEGMGRAARTRAIDELTWDKQVDKLHGWLCPNQ